MGFNGFGRLPWPIWYVIARPTLYQKDLPPDEVYEVYLWKAVPSWWCKLHASRGWVIFKVTSANPNCKQATQTGLDPVLGLLSGNHQGWLFRFLGVQGNYLESNKDSSHVHRNAFQNNCLKKEFKVFHCKVTNQDFYVNSKIKHSAFRGEAFNANSCMKRPTSRPFSNLFCIEIISIIPFLKRKNIFGRLLYKNWTNHHMLTLKFQLYIDASKKNNQNWQN